jgi:hypothetical protein
MKIQIETARVNLSNALPALYVSRVNILSEGTELKFIQG